MKTMNGFTNELLVKRAKRNWRTRCGAFLLAVLTSWYGGGAVFGDAIIDIGTRTLGPDVQFDTTPREGVAGDNAGMPGTLPSRQYIWTGRTDANLNLNALNNVMTVNTTTGTTTLSTTDRLIVSGSATFEFNSGFTWGSGAFEIQAGSVAAINANGGTLNFGNSLDNLGTLALNTYNNQVSSSVVVLGSGSSSSGLITVANTNLSITGNGLGGNGTIDIYSSGKLNITSASLNQDLVGHYNYGGSPSRGLVESDQNVRLDGTLTGTFGFSGGGAFRLTSNNTTIERLYALSSTTVRFTDQNNIGTGDVTLVSQGGLSRYDDGNNHSDVTIANSIHLVGSGSLNSEGTPLVSWLSSGDLRNDSGYRFNVEGNIDGIGNLYINDMYKVSGSGGTVVLTGNNTNLSGDIYINKGVLEINRQANLGTSVDANYRKVVIGDSTLVGRTALRVVGTAEDETSINHWIELVGTNSFYDVFTDTRVVEVPTIVEGDSADDTVIVNVPTDIILSGSDIAAMADADRFTVVQSGRIIGVGNLNKAGDGVLQLNTSNQYTGNTIVWHGVLRINEQDAINNSTTARLVVGGEPNLDTANFRPVFETTLKEGHTEGTMEIKANLVLNQRNSTIRITGEGNRTRFTNEVSSDYYGQGTGYQPILNKDGAGTMVLEGLASWDGGHMNIHQGTVEFSRSENIGKGIINIGTDWHSYKDIEEFDSNGNPIVYKAVLKLADNANATIYGEGIVLNSPAPGTTDDPTSGSYIEVGTGGVLTVNTNITSGAYPESNLNKIGKGELVLAGTKNTYEGWTNVYAGTVTTIVANNLSSSAGVDLIGNGTTFNMSTTANDQIIRGLKGVDEVNADDSSSWTRRVLIGDNTLTLLQTEDLATLHGAILGTGTFVKGGTADSEFRTGFEIGDEKFAGSVSVQAGTLATLTDATFTGITGKAGTYFDVRDNVLTLDINESMQYLGTIISTYPSLPFDKYTVRPEIIKTGVGTLKTGFSEKDNGSDVVTGYFGDLTIEQGTLVSTSDYYMEGGGKLTFGVNSDINGAILPSTLDVSGYNAFFRLGGASGAQYSTVHVTLGDGTTGWSTPSGAITVGKILGGDKSDYSGLVASTTDSLFYSLELRDDRGTGRYDKLVTLNVTGFGGVGDTYNTRAVGKNLDNVRTSDLSGNQELADLIKQMWCVGSNLEDEEWGLASAGISDLLQQMSADTIANAMFMGLDKPWQAAFHRLNLDSQMVYTGPQGGAIANMRNLWFTPTVQSLTARADGNARKFGIDRPGYKIGFDKRVAQNTSVGFQLGYSSPKLHQKDDRVTASDFQFGLYGGSMVGNYIEMKGFIGFGHQNYKSTRSVYNRIDDGLWSDRGLPTKRDYVAHGRYDGDTFNFSFEVSRPLFLGFTIVRPTIGLDSEHAFRYAFTESGSAIAMKFQRSSLSRTRARFGLSFETTTLDRAIFTGRIGYSCLLGGNDYAEAKGQFVNVYEATQVTRSVAVGKSYFEAGVGTRIFLNPVKTLSLVGNYDATIGNRWAEHQAIVGIGYIY